MIRSGSSILETPLARPAKDEVKLEATTAPQSPATSAHTATELSKRPGTPGTGWRLFFTCWIVFALHFATNAYREVYLAMSIGDRLSFSADEYVGLHIDVFEMPGRGAYIAGNPGGSMLGALPYALARPVIDPIVRHVTERRQATGAQPPPFDSPWPAAKEFHRKAFERGLDVKLALGMASMQALGMAPLSAAGVALMYHLLRVRTGSPRAALLLALLFAFATPVFYRTAQLNHNLMVAHFAFFAFAVLYRPWDDPARPQRPRYFLAGLLCGWTVVLDFSGIVTVAVLGLYGLYRRTSLPADARSPWDAAHFTAGVAVAGSILMGYHWVCFGHPLYPAQHYMPPPPHGYRSLVFPQPELLLRTAFDLRYGLFTSAPLLLLAFVPLWLRDWRIAGRHELFLVLAFTAGMFLFCCSIEYGYMQFNTGVRYIVPVVPFLFLLVADVLLRMPPLPAVLIGIAATYWSWCLSMYREVEIGFGVLEAPVRITLEGFRLPWLSTLQKMNYVPATATPLALFAVVAAIIWAIWRVPLRSPRPTST